MLPLSKRYRTSPCHVVHLVNWSGYSVPSQVSWRQQSPCCSNPHDDVQAARVQRVSSKYGGCWWYALSVCFPMHGRFWKLALIRAGVKHVHKPSARTAYQKMISMLSEIPYLNCSSLVSLISSSWTYQCCSFTACFLDIVRLHPLTSFAVMTVRMSSRRTLLCGNPGSRNLRRRKRS